MSFDRIYILCPAYKVTGGSDALHQMCFYLNCFLRLNASIVYFKASPTDSDDFFIPKPFNIYIDSFKRESDIIDDKKNAVIIPEWYTKKRLSFRNCKIYIWWLGINESLTWTLCKKIYFLAALLWQIVKGNGFYRKQNIIANIKSVWGKECFPFGKEPPRIKHLCASYHAFDFVSQRTRNSTFLCIEPLSKFFLNTYSKDRQNISAENRKNIILYNPARKYEDILNEINTADPSLQFIPLQGLTQEQLIEKYKTSKLYIDFGAFPGAERIPKEAVLFGCAIITGRRGASGFHGDVPIPEEYKFENPSSQINEIVKKIRYILDDYENVYSDFDEYRKTVLNLEDNFIMSLKKIFEI